MSIQVSSPFLIFQGLNGLPLENGYIYIGQTGSNPQTTPVPVFFDETLTIPAAQPIRTINGYPSRNGSPANIFTENQYSITVKDKNGAIVYSNLYSYQTPGYNSYVLASSYGDGSFTSNTLNAAISELGSTNQKILINRGNWAITSSVTVPSNIQLIFDNGSILSIDNGVTVYYFANDIIAPNSKIFNLIGTGRFLFMCSTPNVSPQWWGALGDGVNDDSVAILAAANSINGTGGCVSFSSASVSYAMNPTYFDDLHNMSFEGQNTKIISKQPANLPYAVFHFRNCSNIEFYGMDINGRYPYWATQPVNPTFNNFNIVISDCIRMNIHDNYLHDSGYNTGTFDKFGDGVYITGTDSTSCNNIMVCHNFFKDDGRWSIAVLCGSDILISDNSASRSTSATPSIGFIDLEYNPGVGFGNNIKIVNNKCNGACEIVATNNITPGFRNVVVSENSLNGFYDDGSQRITSPYTLGIGLSSMLNLTISDNVIYGIASDNIQAINSENVAIIGNILTADTLFPSSSMYLSGVENAIVKSNLMYNNNSAGYGIQCVDATNVSILGNDVTNLLNVGVLLSGTGGGNRFVNNKVTGVATISCNLGGAPMVVMGNISNTSGRLDLQAHTVIGNQMDFNTIGGTWYQGGGRYIAPDGTTSRSMLWLTASPVTGTWSRGDIVWNSTVSAGGAPGWICTTAGTGGAAVFKAMANVAA